MNIMRKSLITILVSLGKFYFLTVGYSLPNLISFRSPSADSTLRNGPSFTNGSKNEMNGKLERRSIMKPPAMYFCLILSVSLISLPRFLSRYVVLNEMMISSMKI